MKNTSTTHHFSLLLLVATMLLLSMFVLTESTQAESSQESTQWTWPLDGQVNVLRNGQYGTILENTDYGVKNLDLVHPSSSHITCFDVGWHRLYHAGVDLYRADGNTAGAPVKAVANGVIRSIQEDFLIFIRMGRMTLIYILKFALLKMGAASFPTFLLATLVMFPA